jgi:CofD-related protein of GAK system
LRKKSKEPPPKRVEVAKSVLLPDRTKLARLERAPDLGPKILFFSGGTALRETSKKLIRYTHNSTHIITPFDSGGSSAKLREAFNMPAIGDVRNRLMALSDQDNPGNQAVFELFAHRLPTKEDNSRLKTRLENMAKGNNRLVRAIGDPMRKIIRTYLYGFLQHMPDDFNLSGASIGNLVLTAGYLENRRHFDPVIYLFSKLVNVRGLVRPVINQHMHLAGELEDGRVIVGQHLLTGKAAEPIDSPIKRVYLTNSLTKPEKVRPPIRAKVRDLIEQAEMICYPIGSFYSSIIANLLPKGVGAAVAANPSPKLFIPNTGEDPEALGMTVADQVRRLLETLREDDPRLRGQDLLHYVLIDSTNPGYQGGLDAESLEKLGVRVIDCPMTNKKSTPHLDPGLLVQVLLSLT